MKVTEPILQVNCLDWCAMNINTIFYEVIQDSFVPLILWQTEVIA